MSKSTNPKSCDFFTNCSEMLDGVVLVSFPLLLCTATVKVADSFPFLKECKEDLGASVARAAAASEDSAVRFALGSYFAPSSSF